MIIIIKKQLFFLSIKKMTKLDKLIELNKLNKTK